MNKPFAVCAFALLTCGTAFPSINVTASYSPAGEQNANPVPMCATSSLCVVGVEDFSNFYGSTYNTNFTSGGTYVKGGAVPGAITGQYSGGGLRFSADQYGGAGGTGAYSGIFSWTGTQTLLLSTSGSVPGVNYFGLWFSSLDGGNVLTFYSQDTPVYTFTSSTFINLVGYCGGGNAFCGNPNPAFLNQNSQEQFAFLNFVSTGGYIDKITFSQSGGGGFESDNHTIGYLSDPIIEGTVITPEPGEIGMVIAGGVILLGSVAVRRRRSA